MAANNSAEVEKIALDAGVKKGGAAKGELVLAMYELANCYRNGWGIKKDPVAAKQYYETAANLGDTDAMNEVAWCYVEGFGTKKDKVSRRFHLSSPSSVAYASAAASPVCIDIVFVVNGQLGLGHHEEIVLRHRTSPPASFVGLQYARGAADNVATPHSSRRLSFYGSPSQRVARR